MPAALLMRVDGKRDELMAVAQLSSAQLSGGRKLLADDKVKPMLVHFTDHMTLRGLVTILATSTRHTFLFLPFSPITRSVQQS